jgi:hypothetical protein
MPCLRASYIVVGRLAAGRGCDSIPACSDEMFQCQALTATASPGPALLAAEFAAAAAAPISAWRYPLAPLLSGGRKRCPGTHLTNRLRPTRPTRATTTGRALNARDPPQISVDRSRDGDGSCVGTSAGRTPCSRSQRRTRSHRSASSCAPGGGEPHGCATVVRRR